MPRFVSTPIIQHGPGSLAELGGIIRGLGGGRVGLITDPGLVKVGICERVVQAVDDLEGGIVWFDGAEPEPSYELVSRCVAFLRDEHCQVVIGLGGGSALDTAKMAAVMVGNEGDVSDYFGAGRVPHPGLPSIAIPTTAGTGSEVSPAAVFVDPRDGTKKGVRSDYVQPKAAILDPELTLGLPQALTASTGIDALTHAVECYTARAATLISDMTAERAIALIGEHLPVAYADGANLAARDGMLMGSLVAGMALAIANVGAVHALAQALGGSHHVHHGVANSLLLPYVMEFNRMACRDKYARVAALLGEPVAGLSENAAAERAVAAVRQLTIDLQLPQHLRELDIPEDALDDVAERTIATQGRIATNNPRAMSVEDARAILRAAY